MDCSILLATRDRAGSLDRTLASIAAQATDGIRWEVLVADNGSADETPAVLERWAERLPLRWAAEPRPGKNRALNRILGMAEGRLLLFTDDDVIVAPGWIESHWTAAARWPGCDILAGVIRPQFPAGAPAWTRHEPFRSVLFAAYEHDHEEGPIEHLPFGPNYAIRSLLLGPETFDGSVGPNGSEYAMGGETELLRRLRARGAQMAYVPGAVVEHVIREEQLREEFVVTRAARFGRGLVRLGDVEWSPHRLFGVPRYLVRQLVEAWLLRAGAQLRGNALDRLRAEFVYHTVLGSMAECRDSGWPLRPGAPAFEAVPELIG
jgi:glycosyltransferase involved in cell wall biosynthesis